MNPLLYRDKMEKPRIISGGTSQSDYGDRCVTDKQCTCCATMFCCFMEAHNCIPGKNQIDCFTELGSVHYTKIGNKFSDQDNYEYLYIANVCSQPLKYFNSTFHLKEVMAYSGKVNKAPTNPVMVSIEDAFQQAFQQSEYVFIIVNAKASAVKKHLGEYLFFDSHQKDSDGKFVNARVKGTSTIVVFQSLEALTKYVCGIYQCGSTFEIVPITIQVENSLAMTGNTSSLNNVKSTEDIGIMDYDLEEWMTSEESSKISYTKIPACGKRFIKGRKSSEARRKQLRGYRRKQRSQQKLEDEKKTRLRQ